MKIIEIQERTPALLQSLLEIWENSVRATHLFLSGPEIEQINDCCRGSYSICNFRPS